MTRILQPTGITRRRFMEGAAGAAALGAFPGIGGRSAFAQSGDVTLPIVSDRRYEGQTVVVTSQTGPVISGPIAKFGPAWEEATGAKIELVTYPFGQMFEKLRTELATGAYTSDLFNIIPGWAGEFVGAGYLETVPDWVKDLIGMDDYYPTYRDVMFWGDEMYGVVYDGNVHNLFYRRDLFENADYQKRFADTYGYELQVPDSWEQYHDVGKFFNSFDWSGTGQSFGTLEPMGRGTGAWYMLLGRGLSYAKSLGDPYAFFDPDSMKPRINEPGWVQALEDWKRDIEIGPPGAIQQGFSEARPNFTAGRGAMTIDWGDTGTLTYAENSKIRGKTSTALVPGANRVFDRKSQAWQQASNGASHAPFLAVTAWLFGVPKTAEHKEAAWDLAAYLCNPVSSPILVAYPDSGIQPSRKKTITETGYLVDAGMHPDDAKSYLDAIGESVGHPNAVLDLRIPGTGEYYNHFDVESARAMSGELSAQEAMDNAAEKWERTTDRLGRDRQRELYTA